MKFIPLKVIALLPAFYLTGASAAMAGDGHYYPGTMCEIALVSDAGLRALRYTRGGQVLNNSAENRAVITCPVPRDDMDTTARLDVRVFYIDNHLTETVRCELREMEPWGRSQKQISTGQSPGNSICNEDNVMTGGVACTFDIGFNSVTSWDERTPGSSFTLSCGIPPRQSAADPGFRSGIGGYFVVEAN